MTNIKALFHFKLRSSLSINNVVNALPAVASGLESNLNE
jgi:hypothetical protein